MAEDKTFTKEELDAAVTKAVEALDVDGLKSKIDELIGDKKKLQAEARKAKEVDPAEVERLHAEVEELTGKLTAAEKAAKDAMTAAEKAAKALETETAFTQKLLISDGLKSELIKNGVKDEDFIDSLTAKFGSGATVKIDGETRTAMIGDKPLADHIKEWAGSDAGKKFVAAPANSGGGAGGGDNKGGSGKTVTRTAFNDMDQVARGAFIKEGGTVVDQAA